MNNQVKFLKKEIKDLKQDNATLISTLTKMFEVKEQRNLQMEMSQELALILLHFDAIERRLKEGKNNPVAEGILSSIYAFRSQLAKEIESKHVLSTHIYEYNNNTSTPTK